MPTTSTDYRLTKAEIIQLAFAQLNKFGADESIPAEHFNYAGKLLNMQIKTWMDFGYNLWLKKTAYLFTKLNQNTYHISHTSTDNSTLQYYRNSLSATALIAATSVTLTSITDISIGDYLGINLDDNDIYWTRVSNIVGSEVFFTVGDSLPSQASSGALTFNYTTKLDVPLDVYDAVRTDDGIRDIPLNYLSYQEYLYIPNKDDTTSTPVSYQYDRQLDDTIIRLWPTPYNSKVVVKLLIGQRITNMDLNNDEIEFPDEWQLPLVLQLAVLLAPSYGKNKDAGFTNLVAQANQALELAKAFDNEVGSIYFQPNFN